MWPLGGDIKFFLFAFEHLPHVVSNFLTDMPWAKARDEGKDDYVHQDVLWFLMQIETKDEHATHGTKLLLTAYCEQAKKAEKLKFN